MPGANYVPRFTCMIVTSDPMSGVIEANIKGDIRRVFVVSTDVAWRWPIAGETWVVRQENQTWYLDSPAASGLISSVNPGDAIINAPTGQVWVTGDLNDGTPTTFAIDQTSVYQPGDLIVSAALVRAGCLLCDGAGYSTTDYASLHNAIGYIYGGSGAVFHVPDLRGRSPVGAGTGAGLTARSLGQTGGEENHVNTSAQSGMPSHNHGGSTGTGSTGTGTTGFISADHTHVPGSGYTNFIAQNGPVTNIGLVLSSGGTDTALGQTSGVTVNHTHSVPSLSVPALSISTQAAVDATQAHNTMHPFAVVNWFVKT